MSWEIQLLTYRGGRREAREQRDGAGRETTEGEGGSQGEKTPQTHTEEAESSDIERDTEGGGEVGYF